MKPIVLAAASAAFLATTGLVGLTYAQQTPPSPAPAGDPVQPTGEFEVTATLTGTAEVPPNTSPATGQLTGKFLPTDRILQWSVTYEGLSGPATAAHFHGPASEAENAPPVVPVEGDLASPIEGEATLTEEQATALLAGDWYFNVHTAANPGGEIRGQVDVDEEVQEEEPAAPAEPAPAPAPAPAP
ncbi:MAG: CHRD domain-containing protein [Bauldia sp.]|nr:CHRD domain-containing protein [Bauldia sp.]